MMTIKKNLRKHRIRESKFITCEDITHRDAVTWIKMIIDKGFKVIDFKIENYNGNYPPHYNPPNFAHEKIRCVVEYIDI